MQTIHIFESQNGYLVVHGELKPMSHDAFPLTYAYNNIDKAISHIRRRMKDWKTDREVLIPNSDS